MALAQLTKCILIDNTFKVPKLTKKKRTSFLTAVYCRLKYD